jgi:hypothetical protein
MSEEVLVKPYTRYSGKVVSIGSFTYNTKFIPEGFVLVGNAIDEPTESHLINLIDNGKAIELKEIMKCIAKEFEGELTCKLNEYTFGKLKLGEGMAPEREDSKYYNACVVVINMGSDIELTITDTKTRKTYHIMLTRRSMFLLKDKQFKFTRSISKKDEYLIGDNTFKRDIRYSLVFKSRK